SSAKNPVIIDRVIPIMDASRQSFPALSSLPARMQWFAAAPLASFVRVRYSQNTLLAAFVGGVSIMVRFARRSFVCLTGAIICWLLFSPAVDAQKGNSFYSNAQADAFLKRKGLFDTLALGKDVADAGNADHRDAIDQASKYYVGRVTWAWLDANRLHGVVIRDFDLKVGEIIAAGKTNQEFSKLFGRQL